jgi:hypothetical protein
VNREGEGEGIFSRYFICFYENGTMKPIKIVLRRERG